MLTVSEESKIALNQKIVFEYIPMVVTAVGIIVSAIIFKQMVIKVIPLLFSIIINLLNARANRIGFILGSVNSLIYIICYFMEGIYGTMFSAAFGIVMMMTAYFKWKKDSYGHATIFRKLSTKNRMFGGGMLLCAWGLATFVLWKMGGTAVVTDGLSLILGFVIPIMNIWAYVEAPMLNIGSCVIQIFIWLEIIIVGNKLENLTYLISSIYTLYMVARMFSRWYALYKEQQGEKKSLIAK